MRGSGTTAALILLATAATMTEGQLLPSPTTTTTESPGSGGSNQLFCYEYTWMGPDDGKVNTTQDCEYDIANDIPCFEPLVWTTGPYRFNGPDPEELEQACANGGAVDGQTCNPTCVKGGDVCMRYSYFDRDGDQTMSKYVNFCGKGVQNPGGKQITDKCYKQYDVDGYDIEVCFCNHDRCNGATGIAPVYTLLIVAALATAAHLIHSV